MLRMVVSAGVLYGDRWADAGQDTSNSNNGILAHGMITFSDRNPPLLCSNISERNHLYALEPLVRLWNVEVIKDKETKVTAEAKQPREMLIAASLFAGLKSGVRQTVTSATV